MTNLKGFESFREKSGLAANNDFVKLALYAIVNHS